MLFPQTLRKLFKGISDEIIASRSTFLGHYLMTTLYRHAISERIQYELGRLKKNIMGVVGEGGNAILDTCYFNGVLGSRVGVRSSEVERELYEGIVDEVLSMHPYHGTITFPIPVGEEHAKLTGRRKGKLIALRQFGDRPEEHSYRAAGVDALRALRTFMRISPSEALIDPTKKQYRPAVKEALEEISQREGLGKKFYAPHLVGGREDHRENDIEIITTGLLVTLSDQTHNTRIFTRDSEIARIASEIKREDSRGLAALADKYGFPCPSGLTQRFGVIKDFSRGTNSLSQMKLFYDAHLEYEKMRAEQHRRKRSTATV